ncbi:hypothetical protein M378DRAFT_596859 [Amanita muscaria Koide BX008]|uniref:Uncharacterized protein n=1 Tax=Amanita muscaria (strain Koide BX008) TaxID=946122 RepID=A0A0C2WFS3_AMAMK|nr:hypothetical protein M378DRAFT_596859 [Amanita muscaria Koide BX008]
MVDSVVRHVSMATEQRHRSSHDRCRSSPGFKFVVSKYPPGIDLPVEDWQEALKPLLDLQDKLLKTSKPWSCRVTRVMRDLLLSLMFLQRISYPIAAAQVPESNIKETVTKWRQKPGISKLKRPG